MNIISHNYITSASLKWDDKGLEEIVVECFMKASTMDEIYVQHFLRNAYKGRIIWQDLCMNQRRLVTGMETPFILPLVLHYVNFLLNQ
jgi:hypothetical protein